MNALPPAAESTLWARLVALDLDGAAQLSFSGRLARDNGWSRPFARRVVLEYKKFVFLAATCGHPVTPSDEVDQAWHLHLVYTRSYWDELCGQVLGFALHHGPTQGGAAEGHKFQDWYGQTLRAYQAAFGAAAPADIWPVAAVRFGEAPHFRRVNLRRQLLVPRPRWPRLRRGRRRLALALTGTLLTGALLLAGCTTRRPLNPLNWYGTEFLQLFWGLSAGLLTLALGLRRQGRGPEDDYRGEPPGPYALARLAHRGQHLTDSALAAMAHAGRVELPGGQKVKRVGTTPPADPYERAVWNLIIFSGWSDLATVRQAAMGPHVGALRALDEELELKGLLLPPPERRRLDRLPALTALALGGFGLAKVLVGLARGRPVGYLLLSLVALALITLIGYLHGAWATGRGARLLRETAARVRQRRPAGADAPTAEAVALSVGLFGLAELNALGLGGLASQLTPPASSGDGGSGDGGGDGGGGGDSGCGGCGGCGGGGD